jgi:hypothetical protein
MQRLREMPPFAREREIEKGLYSKFSAAEKEILRSGVEGFGRGRESRLDVAARLTH